MPPLSATEFELLKADIAERGVLVPIDVDEQGRVINGRHRLRACRELGIEPPVFVRVGLDEIGKRALARTINTLGRKLSRAQMREVIAGQVIDTPQWSDNRIAGQLNVSGATVRRVRRELERTSQVEKFTVFEGADGKRRPGMRSTFVADLDGISPADLERATVPPDQEQAIWEAVGRCIAVDTTEAFDPFAGCTDTEIAEWQRFELWLVTRAGYAPVGAAEHTLWLRQRPFTLTEWLGPDGAAFRSTYGMREMTPAARHDWETFTAAHAVRDVQDLSRELAALHAARSAAPAMERA
jgi:hypothetical protein